MRETGIYEGLGDLRYFIPHFLSLHDSSTWLTNDILSLHHEALLALSQLNLAGNALQNTDYFIKNYVAKEAILSSAIEGVSIKNSDNKKSIHLDGSLEDKEATQAVQNYIASLNAGMHMIRDESFPLVSRVILRAHEILMSSGEDQKYSPGHFRKQSVRVGDLVPPPAPYIPALMGELENYMNQDLTLPPLIRIGLVHVQFETIHPFLDGNGRLGRLLIVLMLILYGLLDNPILYPSYYFKKNLSAYYEKLDHVRTHGDLEGWLSYYLTAIRNSSMDALRNIQKHTLSENQTYKAS